MVEEGFPANHLAKINRSLIIGLGNFGTRTLGHIWSRLCFEDFQRRILRPELPELGNIVGFSLLLPWDNGGFIIGSPDSAKWEEYSFIRKAIHLEYIDFIGQGAQREEYSFYNEEIPKSLNPETIVEKQGPSESIFRNAFFDTALENIEELGNHFVQVTDSVRIHEDAPGHEINKFSIYVITALHEQYATPFIMPIVKTLRQYLQPHLIIKIHGFFSAGSYGNKDQRQKQGAAIYSALQEITDFSQSNEQSEWVNHLSIPEEWGESDLFDHYYILDSEKQNLTRPSGEDEVIAAIGNTLEVLILSEASDHFESVFGPDEYRMKRANTFNTLSAASIYIPIDEWRTRHIQKYTFEILGNEFLDVDLSETSDIEEEVSQIAGDEGRLTALDDIVRNLIQDCPFEMDELQETDLLGQLFQESGHDEPLTAKGRSVPFPFVQIQSQLLETEYRETDPVSERRRRLPPERWLGHLFRHYRELGLPEDQIFPGDPDLHEWQAQYPAPDQTQADHWFALMVRAGDSSDSLILSEGQVPEKLRELVRSDETTGIVPGTKHYILQIIGRYLLEGNQGLVRANHVFKLAKSRVLANIRQIADFRIRLSRVMESSNITQMHTDSARRRLAFNRLLQNRPRLPALISRLILLTSFLSVLAFYTFPLIVPRDDLRQFSLLIVLGALAFSGAVGVSIHALLLYRLRRILRRLENDLGDLLTLQINNTIAQLLVNDDGLGLIHEISRIVIAASDMLTSAVNVLAGRKDDLELDLDTPIALIQPFLRQPLPGLEEIEQQLYEEARSTDGDERATDPQIIRHDKEVEEEQFRGILHKEMDYFLERVTTTTEDKSAEIEEERTRSQEDASIQDGSGYTSLGDLIFAIIGRYCKTKKGIVPPMHLQIEHLLRSHYLDYTPQNFINDLSARTQPMLDWDDSDLPSGLPVSLDLLAMNQPSFSIELAPFAADCKLKTVTTLDPFSITYLRDVRGLTLSSVPHFKIYKQQYMDIGTAKREKLALFGTQASPLDMINSDEKVIQSVDSDEIGEGDSSP